ncbi:hypothetical protein AB0392_59415 [Nonomuraea angiospora]|uniref:hypothetical protein n=1 Tax=Nonomuraea angiospora TaxID=46172 RepID=UPI00344B2B84
MSCWWSAPSWVSGRPWPSWWSEPGPLPGRTHLAFGMLTVFCLAWAGYGGRLVTRRVPLFAADRVIAAWLGLAASLTTTGVLAAVAVQS